MRDRSLALGTVVAPRVQCGIPIRHCRETGAIPDLYPWYWPQWNSDK